MKRKLLAGVALALMLALSLVGPAMAAPVAQEETPTTETTGTVVSITVETDATTGENTVIVELLDDMGATQVVELTVDEAVALGLVSVDPDTGDVTPIDEAIGTDITVGGEEEAEHPVGSVLAEFFGVDYGIIMETHEEGVGFGVIAQALWMSQQLEGGSEMFTLIVEAKQNHDYSGITMPDGSTPANWGQFKKALQEQGQNLGQVMSGRAEPLEDESGEGEGGEGEGTEETTLNTQEEKGNNGNGNGHGNGNGRGHGKGKGKNK